MAPVSAPISGRANSRAQDDPRLTRSSLAGGGVTGDWSVWLMETSHFP
jgi:hypothetical protein